MKKLLGYYFQCNLSQIIISSLFKGFSKSISENLLTPLEKENFHLQKGFLDLHVIIWYKLRIRI